MHRYKRRLRDHHRKIAPVDGTPAQQYILAAADTADDEAEPETDRPVVIAEMSTEIENLTVGEAVMRLDLADQTALVFRNSAHGGLNVVYRRADGNLGWIDPEGMPAGNGSA